MDKNKVMENMLYAFRAVDATDKARAFIVDGIWYTPKWGCDSLQHFVDMLSGEE